MRTIISKDKDKNKDDSAKKLLYIKFIHNFKNSIHI